MRLADFLLGGALAVAAAFPAQAQQGVDLTDQTQSPNFAAWTMYGSATGQNFTPGNGYTYSTLDLTTAGSGDQAGAGWAPLALTLDFNQPFGFKFYFNIHNTPTEWRGDGLTLTLADATGIGGTGSDLGYAGLSGHSVAFAIDTFHFDGEPVSPSLQILSQGSVSPVSFSETGLGDSLRNAQFASLGTLDYLPSGQGDNSGTLTGTIWNLDLGSYSVQAEVDFNALGLVDVPVFYGFTAANGAATDGHTVQWGAAVPVPEPGTGTMIAAGLACLLGVARRRRPTA